MSDITNRHSLRGYFDHIEDKVYIDHYPKSVIKLDELKNQMIVELGGGLGNDARWLLDFGVRPTNFYFVELDRAVYEQARTQLSMLAEQDHLFLEDAKRTSLATGLADYVYANNVLHCVGSEISVLHVLEEAYRLLNEGGVLFGRTLHDNIDYKKCVL